MAARRFLKPTINWASLAEKIPESQRAEFFAFKSRSDGYLRKMTSLPEEPPKIDWNQYKSKVPAALVESFQKQYESFKVPYPQDTYSSVYDKEEKAAMEDVSKFIALANETIKKEEITLKFWDNIPPIETMTMQEFAEYFPDKALNTYERPTYWPHSPEWQLTEEDEKQWQDKLDGKVSH